MIDVPTHLGESKTKTQFVQTVEQNESFYTARQIERAKAARRLLATLGMSLGKTPIVGGVILSPFSPVEFLQVNQWRKVQYSPVMVSTR